MKYLWVPLVRRNAKMDLVYIWDQFLGNFPKKIWIRVLCSEFACCGIEVFPFKSLNVNLRNIQWHWMFCLQVTVVLHWSDSVLPCSLTSWCMLERPLGLPLLVFLLTPWEQVTYWCTVWGVLDPLGRLRNVQRLNYRLEVFHYPGL